IGNQKAHSPVNRETQRDFTVVFAEIRSASDKAGLMNRLVELAFKHHCRTADVQTDSIRLVMSAHQPFLQVDHIVHRRPPMPRRQRGPQPPTSCGQKKTKRAVELPLFIELSLREDPGIPLESVQYDRLSVGSLRRNA